MWCIRPIGMGFSGVAGWGVSRTAGLGRPMGMTKFLLIQHHVAMGGWKPADIRHHYDYQTALDAELAAAGELVETQGLAGLAHLVTGDGPADEGLASGMPALAGYRIVDV